MSWTNNEDDRWNLQRPASSSFGASSPTADNALSSPASVVSAFTDKLKAEARKNGGVFSESDLDQLSQEFKATQGDLEKIFGLAFD